MRFFENFHSFPLYKLVNKVAFVLSFLALFVIIYDLGVFQSRLVHKDINHFYLFIVLTGIVSVFLRYLYKESLPRYKVIIYDILNFIFISFVIAARLYVHEPNGFFRFAVFLTFIREYSTLKFSIKRTLINPIKLLIFSFLFVIFLGTLLLMLPNATFKGISFIDAFFTSTSAVCVTGLIVVDTATYFTQFGQIVIMVLIQLGGLGILTFAGYFIYFFTGGTNYENRLTFSDMTNSQNLNDVFVLLKRILIITFVVESFGALLIFFSLDQQLIQSTYEKIFFSVFHSVSAFCNAGFSLLTNNMYEIGYRYNYFLHLTLIFLIIIGGLGFPIVSNILKYIKYLIVERIFQFSGKKKIHIPWVLNLNSRIVIITTILLLVFGTVLIYIVEYNNTLAEHGPFGKIVTALFTSTTPRTAGFNSIDFSTLKFSTILLIIFLMWIGASPASTGGGIKTSVFAISVLNFISLSKGKTRLELFRREISDISVRRAFATIFLSFLVIGIAIWLISIFDSGKSLIAITFETFSAYSTVGLSIGITAFLSSASKIIIIIVMFIGRLSTLTLLMAFIKKEKYSKYRYPNEEVIIN
jgi:trk system potassium uptake protein TrkH